MAKKGHGAEKETQCRNCRRKRRDPLREHRMRTRLQSGRADMRRKETGLAVGLLGKGRFTLTAVGATTLHAHALPLEVSMSSAVSHW